MKEPQLDKSTQIPNLSSRKDHSVPWLLAELNQGMIRRQGAPETSLSPQRRASITAFMEKDSVVGAACRAYPDTRDAVAASLFELQLKIQEANLPLSKAQVRYLRRVVALQVLSDSHAADGWEERTAKLDQHYGPGYQNLRAVDIFLGVANDPQHASGGYAVMLMRNGTVEQHGASGFAYAEAQRKIDYRTNFRLASLTKAYIAMAVLHMCEQGQLKLDDKVSDFFPGYGPKFKDMAKNATIRHLLLHESGIPDTFDLYEKAKLESGGEHGWNDDQVIRFVLEHGQSEFEPGTSRSYSNTGYILLGQILSKRSGMPLSRYLEEHLFKPLGMNDTKVFEVKDGQEPLVPHRAFGYAVGADGKVIFQDRFSYTLGDGGIYSSIADIQKWIKALSGNPLVSADTLKLMFTQQTLDNGEPIPSGYGVYMEPIPSGWVYQNLGEDGAVQNVQIRLPEEGVTLVLLSNNTVKDARAAVVAQTILSRFVGETKAWSFTV